MPPVPTASLIFGNIIVMRIFSVLWQTLCHVTIWWSLATVPAAVGADLTGRQAKANEYRQEVVLDKGWKFHPGALPVEQAVASTLEDASWQTVTIPHTWLNKNSQRGVDLCIFDSAWYRLKIAIPQLIKGKRHFLRFQGSNFLTEAWLNGQKIGEHRGGHTAFHFEITDKMIFGDNVVMVHVNNELKHGQPAHYANFNQYGGLYRPVSLITVDDLHVTLNDRGSSGIRIKQGRITPDQAELSATITVRNGRAESAEAGIEVMIVDQEGKQVAVARIAKSIPAGHEIPVQVPFVVEHPRLWQGRVDPHLYFAQVKVALGDRVTDRVDQRFGIRSLVIDPERGTFLNGKRYDLHGVNLHQDRRGKGWAVTTDDVAEDIRLIKEMGATFVRLAHYPHQQATYDLLDEAGLLAWSEILCVWQFPINQTTVDICREQLVEMIRQLGNHPSIVVWGLYNEIPNGEQHKQLIRGLVQLAHEEDSTRPTTGSSLLSDADPLHSITDLIGLNRYFGWYMPSTDQMGPWADRCHAQNPKLLFGISEYGSSASPYKHTDMIIEPLTRFRGLPGRGYPEEYQAWHHERIWSQLRSRDYLWCKIIWEMFDHATMQGRDADEPGICDMGLVTHDRQVLKDAYFFYKASWTDDAMVHICSRRFDPRTRQSIDLKVYSNLPELTARLNGVALADPERDGVIWIWKKCRLATGPNVVQVTGTKNGEEVRDQVEWNILSGDIKL
jgi:beta-galactosidase